jgi:hypothetical protein
MTFPNPDSLALSSQNLKTDRTNNGLKDTIIMRVTKVVIVFECTTNT